MRHVRTFSRYFPKDHPRQGEPTYFVEKFYNSMYGRNNLMYYPEGLDINSAIMDMKHHTIRAGHHINVGDKISFRVWSNNPYKSKHIILAPDVEVVKTLKFETIPSLWLEECQIKIEGKLIDQITYKRLVRNDGLSGHDFACWFFGSEIASSKRKPFDGQIILWANNIQY